MGDQKVCTIPGNFISAQMVRSGLACELMLRTAGMCIAHDVTMFWEAHLSKALCHLRDVFIHSHSQVSQRGTCKSDLDFSVQTEPSTCKNRLSDLFWDFPNVPACLYWTGRTTATCSQKRSVPQV